MKYFNSLLIFNLNKRTLPHVFIKNFERKSKNKKPTFFKKQGGS